MEPFQGGPGDDSYQEKAQQPPVKPPWYAWVPIVVGSLTLLMIAGLIVFSSMIDAVRLGIILLLTPVLLLNLGWLVVYGRRINTPAGKMITGLATFGISAGMMGLFVMAFVIAFFYCASHYQEL